MLTKTDIKNLMQVFPTKAELEQMRVEMATKDQLNDVMNKLDSFIGEVRDTRQEQAMHQGQHERNFEEHDELNKRLQKVETRVGISK